MINICLKNSKIEHKHECLLFYTQHNKTSTMQLSSTSCTLCDQNSLISQVFFAQENLPEFNLTSHDSWFMTRFWISTTEFLVIVNLFKARTFSRKGMQVIFLQENKKGQKMLKKRAKKGKMVYIKFAQKCTKFENNFKKGRSFCAIIAHNKLLQ